VLCDVRRRRQGAPCLLSTRAERLQGTIRLNYFFFLHIETNSYFTCRNWSWCFSFFFIRWKTWFVRRSLATKLALTNHATPMNVPDGSKVPGLRYAIYFHFSTSRFDPSKKRWQYFSFKKKGEDLNSLTGWAWRVVLKRWWLVHNFQFEPIVLRSLLREWSSLLRFSFPRRGGAQ